ncbi:copper amine oxidase N-terminal domain-containing protein [Paenibacillus crassostreae]|uniref:Copper amine oxidase-like N-terminal domain-containing protein n=1 Tax=Paenibacillus crassostreae TaxID=1763538 RepID=A0A167FKH3_9BACL|nr:copper amine oxidase N-terminal domain-containing protein [Paenibacillus crassostreae]AOZ94308.1 hypothetical protein LPB68_20295 [Paenibacillus crassostreae]OAB76654.1 hypothetical protein PNBC_04445 [Paenibacillus crassostreae]
MKKLLTALSIVSILSVTSIASAAEPIQIYVNNDKIQTNVAPIIKQGRVLVPIRVVSEALGAKVAWDQKANTVTIRKWAESLILTVGKNIASIDGKPDYSGEISIDVSVHLENNRLYVPLRFLSEHYGYGIDWDSQSVTIKSPLSDKERKTLYEGTLQQSRELAMDLIDLSIVHYEQSPLDVTFDEEDHSSTFLFPEGESLRFYVLKGDTVLLYEFKDDFPIVTWQAHIQKGDMLQNFLDYKVFDKKGTAATINKKMLYYNFGYSGDSSTEISRSIDVDKKFTLLGFEHRVGGEVTNKEGNISLELPNETRKEVMK